MKNYVIAGLICVVVALAFGIEPVQRVVNEWANRGTLRGVETCIEYSESVIVSADAVRASCVQTFQKRLYDPDLASGLAGPRSDDGKVGWGGTLENETHDHVTTWIKISVMVYDDDGAKQEVFAETSVWIEPMGQADFLVELPDLEIEQFDGTEHCDIDDDAPKACMAWAIVDVKGLAI